MSVKYDSYRQILRLFLPQGNEDVRVQEAIEFCKKINCSEVMVFTGCFDFDPSFLSVEDVRKRTETILRPALETLQSAGLKVSLNILQTLGHHYFPDDPEYRRQFPFQERITIDGKGGGGACPIDKNLIEWVKQTYAVYAELKPEYIFVDDDFRTMMKGGMTCFCPAHLAEISARAGREVSRQEVVDAIFNEPDSPLRKHYFDVTTEGFVSLAKVIHATVKAVSPETRIGLMSACLPHAGAGVDLEKVVMALAGNDRPLLRPQVSLYYEVMIHNFPELVFNPSLMRASLADGVEFFAELECTPYGPFAKSGAMTAAHAFALIMQGFTTQAFTFFDTIGHSLTESVALTEAFSGYNAFFNRAASLIPENNTPLGINTVVGKNILRVRHADNRSKYFNDRELALSLPLCGLPLGTDEASPFQVLTGDDLRTMDNSRIDRILKKGALLDVAALNALHDLGFGDRIGIRAGDVLEADDVGIEEFNFGFGEEFDSTRFRQPLRFFYYEGLARFVKLESDERAKAWSVIRNFKRDNVAPGLLVRENEAGERFAVIPFTGDAGKKFIPNFDRSRQLRNVFSYIARRPLPLAIRETAPYIWLLLNRGSDGELYAGVVNCSTDVVRELPFVCGEEFARGLIRITDSGEEVARLTSEITPDADGTGAVCYSVAVDLAPMQFAFFKAVK